MEYSIYKLEFHTGVHFGTGMLNESTYAFQADQLFSSLYIEALKLECATEFYEAVDTGRLLFSDAFPYLQQEYLIPKPMIYVKPLEQGISEQKKLFKKVKYIPIEMLDDFLNGTVQLHEDPMKGYGAFVQQTMANVRSEDETLPFRVGSFFYQDGCGLYLVVAYEGMDEKVLLENLLESLSYTGIGGKKSAGMGKFTLKVAKMPEILNTFENKTSRQILFGGVTKKKMN